MVRAAMPAEAANGMRRDCMKDARARTLPVCLQLEAARADEPAGFLAR